LLQNNYTSFRTFDYIIIGAGLAGLSLADSLVNKGCSIAVIDKKGIGGGASGIPIGMADPAASRNANLYWETEKCYDTTLENLKKLQFYSKKPFFKITGVLRPGITHKRGVSLERSFYRQDWPDGWCEWKTEEMIKKMSPEVYCVYGGLWHPNSIAVAIPEYLDAYHTYLKEQNVQFYILDDYHLINQSNSWTIQSYNSNLNTDNIVFATGADTKQITYWAELPIEPVKGQVALFDIPDPLPFSFSLSGNGYIGRIEDRRFIVGSTYEHDFEHIEPDEYGKKYLIRKLNQSLPNIAKDARLTGQWAEVRASTPNRLPILGTHRSYADLHIMTGMGSKGLLYSKYTANLLADYLVDNSPLKKEVDVERIYNRFRKQDLI
jgi:glycine oxidase